MSDAVSKTAQGKRVEISEKGDWVSFHIDVGTQYPLRLNTKVKAVIDAARDFGTGTGIWHYKESQGNENPNKPGTYFTNRYLEKVEPVTAENAVAAPSPGTSGDKVDPQVWKDKDQRIARESVLRSAVMLAERLPAVQGEDIVVTVLRAAQRLENWIYRGQGPVPSSSGAEMPQTVTTTAPEVDSSINYPGVYSPDSPETYDESDYEPAPIKGGMLEPDESLPF